MFYTDSNGLTFTVPVICSLFVHYDAADFHKTPKKVLNQTVKAENLFFSSSDAPLGGYHGYHPAAAPAQAQLSQKVRVRTVFTDAQVRQLEALFDVTDYPPAEARAELAKSSGLSEETVRVGLRDVTVAFPFF